MVTTENQLNLSLGDNKKDLADIPLPVNILSLGNILNPGNLSKRGNLSIRCLLKEKCILKILCYDFPFHTCVSEFIIG
jgi:hypothetical protein